MYLLLAEVERYWLCSGFLGSDSLDFVCSAVDLLFGPCVVGDCECLW